MAKAFSVVEIGNGNYGIGVRGLSMRFKKSRAQKLVSALNAAIRAATFTAKNPGRRSRSKGHGFERDVANAFKTIGFANARRQLEYHADDAKGIDLQGTGLYLVQCKKFKGYAPISAIEEIQSDFALGEIPVLVTAGDGLEPMAVLPFKDFLRLAK